MSDEDRSDTAAGCLVVIGLICIAVGFGAMFGPAAGFAAFGVAIIVLVRS